MMMFLELPASLYLKFDNPNAVSIAHMKHKRAATMTWGIDAMKPPTLPVEQGVTDEKKRGALQCIRMYGASFLIKSRD